VKRSAEQSISEKRWLEDVVEAGQLFSWRIYHTYDSRRSQPGFPDLVCVRDRVVLFVELKTDRGRLTVDQRDWLGALAQCDQIKVRLWRPQDRTEMLSDLCPTHIRVHLDGKA
jgi:hypothetical protein